MANVIGRKNLGSEWKWVDITKTRKKEVRDDLLTRQLFKTSEVYVGG
jgi:hypothetical protein